MIASFCQAIITIVITVRFPEDVATRQTATSTTTNSTSTTKTCSRRHLAAIIRDRGLAAPTAQWATPEAEVTTASFSVETRSRRGCGGHTSGEHRTAGRWKTWKSDSPIWNDFGCRRRFARRARKAPGNNNNNNNNNNLLRYKAAKTFNLQYIRKNTYDEKNSKLI